MFEQIASLITAVKNGGPPIYAAALIATALLLFLPDSVMAQLGLIGFRYSHRMQLGIGFVASISLLAASIISPGTSVVRARLRAWRRSRYLLATMRDLTEAEKDFLRPYIHNGENTRTAEVFEGVVKGLELKGIVYRASTVSEYGMRFAYNLQPPVRKLLRSKPHLLS